MTGKPYEVTFRRDGDRVLFPDQYEKSDVPLNCFQIRRANLDSDDGTVLLILDSQFVHYDEHGCYILVRGNQVERFGTWDDVLGDYDYEDGEEEYS